MSYRCSRPAARSRGTVARARDAADRFIGVGATDNFLVAQTMTLKLETKMIFITRFAAIVT